MLECIHEGVSHGTVSLPSSYRDLTRVVVELRSEYHGSWGQIDLDDLLITNAP